MEGVTDDAILVLVINRTGYKAVGNFLDFDYASHDGNVTTKAGNKSKAGG